MSQRTPPVLSPIVRVALSLFLPLLGAILFSLVTSGAVGIGADQRQAAPTLAGAGLLAMFTGLVWYGLRGLGLRGGRPLYAGIGFASLAWVAFLLARLVTVELIDFGSEDSARTLIFIALFEAYSVQVWTFGLFFRSAADWRGPLTAAVASGAVFGLIGFLLFQEPTLPALLSLGYYSLWGILYGIIRLRTGSLLGTVLIHTLHSWTAWSVLVTLDPLPAIQLRNLYLVSIVFYIIIIWRLWPRREEDYRV
ncbi:MAG: CPBP family intramembrane glutamic endopeptidase [Candidatus Promineifilaceae bacterium]|nr:CPBP family intramembrane glutamic endopeptidase [Candidatus Promineifilaceae bacterium]